MTQSNEAVARYHKLMESDPFRDGAWARALQTQMESQHLMVEGRPISPVIRPHFLTRRQYSALVKAAETLLSALERMEKLALATPSLLSRMQLLPAEKMLAAIDPGYPFFSVTALLDTTVDHNSFRFRQYDAENSSGATFGDALADIFFESALMQEMRKRYTISKASGSNDLLEALLSAYRAYGGTQQPRIALLEFRHPFQTAQSGEDYRLAELFRKAGYQTELVSPEQLEYKGGVLRRGDFEIDLLYRRVKTHEFLIRCDLNHPLVRAYRDHKVCMVNSFKAELGQKKSIFDLLTDETVTASFPANEKKVIQEHVPWTRIVSARQTQYHGEKIDLPEFIKSHREQLVMQPNDADEDMVTFFGAEMDDQTWDRGLRTALRNPYVVQEVIPQIVCQFPVLRYGQVEMQKMRVDVTPHAFLGKIHSCSAWLSAEGASGFSTLAGVTPAFIIDQKP